MSDIIILKSDSGSIEALAAPYGGPRNGRDAHGEYFSKDTDFLENVIPYPPVFYYHGAMGTPVSKNADYSMPIGVSTDRWRDDRGLWFAIKLDASNPAGQRMIEAVKNNTCYVSSGVVPASRVVDETGHIRRWLIGEISLMDGNAGQKPANAYAVAQQRLAVTRGTLTKSQQELFDGLYGLGGWPTTGRRRLSQFLAEDSFSPEALADYLTQHLLEGEPADTIDADNNDYTNRLREALTKGLRTFRVPSPVATIVAERLADNLREVEMDPETNTSPTAQPPSADAPTPAASVAPVAPVAPMAKVDAPSAAEIELEAVKADLARLQTESARRDFTDYVTTFIAAGSVTPAEVLGLVDALMAARVADSYGKSAGTSLVELLKNTIAQRPSAITGQPAPIGARIVGNATVVDGSNTVDESFVKRVLDQLGAK